MWYRNAPPYTLNKSILNKVDRAVCRIGAMRWEPALSHRPTPAPLVPYNVLVTWLLIKSSRNCLLLRIVKTKFVISVTKVSLNRRREVGIGGETRGQAMPAVDNEGCHPTPAGWWAAEEAAKEWWDGDGDWVDGSGWLATSEIDKN